jgi:hypothetical protein
MVARHEGDVSAACAAQWFDRQTDSFIVYRRGVEVQGFLAILSLHDGSANDIEADPVTDTVWRYLQRVAPPAVDEHVTVVRFLMDSDAYQAPSHLLNVAAVQHSLNVLNRPRLVWDCFVGAHPISTPAGSLRSSCAPPRPNRSMTRRGGPMAARSFSSARISVRWACRMRACRKWCIQPESR